MITTLVLLDKKIAAIIKGMKVVSTSLIFKIKYIPFGIFRLYANKARLYTLFFISTI